MPQTLSRIVVIVVVVVVVFAFVVVVVVVFVIVVVVACYFGSSSFWGCKDEGKGAGGGRGDKGGKQRRWRRISLRDSHGRVGGRVEGTGRHQGSTTT